MIEDRFVAAHILGGRNLIRVGRTEDLEDTPELWAQLWERHRGELLPAYISENPGSRPAAFYEFDCDALPEREEEETETEFLARVGLLEDAEIQAIVESADEIRSTLLPAAERPDDDDENYDLSTEAEWPPHY